MRLAWTCEPTRESISPQVRTQVRWLVSTYEFVWPPIASPYASSVLQTSVDLRIRLATHRKSVRKSCFANLRWLASSFGQGLKPDIKSSSQRKHKKGDKICTRMSKKFTVAFPLLSWWSQVPQDLQGLLWKLRENWKTEILTIPLCSCTYYCSVRNKRTTTPPCTPTQHTHTLKLYLYKCFSNFWKTDEIRTKLLGVTCDDTKHGRLR